MVRLVESDTMICVYAEVTCVDVIPFHNHLEDLWLVYCALLHEVYDLVLNHNRVIYVVIKLNLHLVLQLTGLIKELLLFHWLREIFIVFGQKVEFTDVSPRVESITHWVLSPHSHVLATSEKVHLVNLPLEMFPVEDMRHPEESICEIEDALSELPRPA